MIKHFIRAGAAACCLLFGVTSAWGEDGPSPEQKVRDVERAFAQTMADRDFEAFKSYLSEEAVFFAGDTPTRGRQAVADSWARYFEGEQAPFSWEPQVASVLESGTLALSSGPVYNADGERVGTFNSIWRLDEHGDWKIIFDKGGQYCPPPGTQETE